MVEELLALEGSESVLDVGCGPGLYAKPLKRRGHEVWAIDFAAEMVAMVTGHVDHASVADIETFDLGRTFDRILCLGVLEFVAQPEAVFDRLRDHLAPMGRLVVLVPRQGFGGWIYKREKRKHGLTVRLCSESMLRRWGDGAGLSYVGRRIPFIHNLVVVFQKGQQ